MKRCPHETLGMITYKRRGDESGVRFRDLADGNIPSWADDIQPLNPKIADVYVTVKARVHYWDDQSFDEIVDECELAIQYAIGEHLTDYHDVTVELDKGIDVL